MRPFASAVRLVRSEVARSLRSLTFNFDSFFGHMAESYGLRENARAEDLDVVPAEASDWRVDPFRGCIWWFGNCQQCR